MTSEENPLAVVGGDINLGSSGFDPNVCTKFKTAGQRHELLHSFRQFQSEGKFVDLQIVGQDRGQTFNCHRLVIASASTLIAQFLKDHDAGELTEEFITIIIPDMNGDQLVKFANHIYGGINANETMDSKMDSWLKCLGVPLLIPDEPVKPSMPVLTQMLNASIPVNILPLPQPKFTCPFKACNEVFSNFNQVENHLVNGHKVKSPQKVPIKEEENAELSHKCHLCDQSFSTDTYLKHHISLHCEDCGKKFTTPAQLSQHMSVFHRAAAAASSNTNNTPFICEMDECNKTFKTKRYLLQHLKTHDKRSGLPCNICKRVLAGRRELMAHLRVHTGEKPYGCQECGKTFRNRSTCNTHMKLHKNSRTHVCSICKHAFIQSGDLRKHIRSRHSNEKPYSCDECGKTFARSDYLLKHTRAHRKLDQPEPELDDATDGQVGDDDVNALLREAMLNDGVALESLDSAEPIELVLPD